MNAKRVKELADDRQKAMTCSYEEVQALAKNVIMMKKVLRRIIVHCEMESPAGEIISSLANSALKK